MEGLTMTNDFKKMDLDVAELDSSENSAPVQWSEISRQGKMDLDVAKNLLRVMREKYDVPE